MNHNKDPQQQSNVRIVIDEEADCSATQNPLQENSHLKNEMLDHLARSKAIFKSQHKDEPELSFEEKRTIASNLLERRPSQFLSRFGNFLKKEHLSNFENINSDDYEISFYLKRLQRNFQKTSKGRAKWQIDVKNRRYEALKSLVAKGEYFSETEMMKRNPLLYDQLVGKYLTEEQKKLRDNIDTQNITFVNLLMESIDRDIVRNFKRDQQDAEDEVEKEFDSDEENDDDNCAKKNKSEENEERSTGNKENKKWGEISHVKDSYEAEKHERQKDLFCSQIPSIEQHMLKQEFVSNMYQSFLDGRDIDFDYSTVDDNEDYDNVELRTQDEEEQYFDSESPEIVVHEKAMDEDESEDELEAYMKTLKGNSPTNELGMETDNEHLTLKK